MASVHSMRDFHNQLSVVFGSLEALFLLAGDDYRELEAAASPALLMFRELLDLGDKIAGDDIEH